MDVTVNDKDIELVLDHVDNMATWPQKVWNARMRLAVAVDKARKENK